jgi:hypothetical protein
MIVNAENENDMKLLNIDNISNINNINDINDVNDNFNNIKTIYSGRIKIEDITNDNTSNTLNLKPKTLIQKLDSSSIQVLPREKRKALYGIDCISDVVFSKWKVGNEYVKALTLKNITTKTQKIKYVLPNSKTFLLDFPQTITLCAGMSASILITFIPEEKKIYKDVLPIDCSFGRFYINISSAIPKHAIEIPKSMSFGYCPVNEVERKTFVMRNTGELVTNFEWKACEPYHLVPEKGKIEPKKAITIEVSFQPYEASVFKANAICVYGDESDLNSTTLQKCFKIDGIGKFSYINIEENIRDFDFGEIYIGNEVEYPLNIVNYSNVVSNFKITAEDKKTKPVFKFLSTSGSIPPGEVYKTKIIYKPNCPNLQSIEYFNIETVSGNNINIKCSGVGVGPTVSLSTNIVNFNAVEEGSKNTKAFYLRNTSETPAYFNFQIEEGAIFQFDKTSGIINPESELLITVTFQPFKTINYYRRVYCLIENADTLWIDILGTCFNEKRRPVTLSAQNLEAYKKRIDNGLFFLCPENIDEMIKNNFIIMKDNGLAFSTSKTYVQSSKVEEHPYDECIGSSEFYNQDNNQNLEVTLLDTFIDFGSCSMYRIVEGKSIRIVNNTRGNIGCVWILPWETKKTKPEDFIFSVTPKTATILPKSSFQFKVNFKPNMENKFYSTELECYCYYKSMRNFRMVSEQTLTPSWCLTPKIMGNTFPPDINNFLPNIEFSNKIIHFPSIILNKTYYRTIRIQNPGDTIVRYSFMNEDELQELIEDAEIQDNKKKIFSIREANGILTKNEAKLMVVRFEPVEEKIYNVKQNCYLNNSYKNKYELLLKGECDSSSLIFDNDNTVFFKPVCINSSTDKTFNGRNMSNIKLYYKWKIPKNYKNTTIITPTQGIIKPNEIVTMNCIFIPSSIKNWTIRIPCYYSCDINALNDAFDDNDKVKDEYQNIVKRSTLTILGQGIIGSIVSDQPSINYGAVLINTDNEREFMITNPSKCDMDFDIKIYKVKRIVLSEEEKRRIILKRQENIRKKIMEEEKRKNKLDNKDNSNPTNNNSNGNNESNTTNNNINDNKTEKEKLKQRGLSLLNDNSNNNNNINHNLSVITNNTIINNSNINGDNNNTINNDPFVLNNEEEDDTEYLNERDYEKEELIDSNNSEITILGLDNQLSSHAGRNLKIRLNLKEEENYKYRIYYTLNTYKVNVNKTEINTVLKPRTKEKKYYLMEVTAQGVYPSLWINDISSDGYVKSLLWELFDINNFNDLIRKIFIDKELNEEIEENKALIDRNNYDSHTNNHMSEVLCQFGSVINGSPCTDIYVNFNNNSVVPVEWKFQFPNDLQNDIEKWAKGEVTSDEQLKLNLILDNQLFSITPKSGNLLPGESMNVKFTYKHDIVGTHRLPVILKIQNGSITETKDLIITLYGSTIPLNKKSIMFPSMQHRFKDVSISTVYPPIQQYFLRNCGSTNIEYIIDTSPLEKLKKDNYNFEILKCLNSTGIIYPGETQYTEWIFKPLEAKEYSVDIPIHIKDGQTKIVTFTGKGVRYTMPYLYDADLEDPLKEDNDDHISQKQLLKIPNQIVVLSDERIRFGHVPTGSISRRIITIKNISATEKVSFTWNIKDDQDEIKISPRLGTLEPGQSRLCKIRFKPSNQPKVYALNIGCVIVNLTKMDKYYIKKHEVEEIIRKKKYLRKLSLNLINEKSNDLNMSTTKLNYNIRKTKYNPLPPIGSTIKLHENEHDSSNDDFTQKSQNKMNSEEQKLNKSTLALISNDASDLNSKINEYGRIDFPELPKPPNPSNISIEIISESHEPFEYKKHFKNYDNYYFEKETFETENKVLDDDSMSIVFSTVQFILNNILQDLEIQNLTNHLKFETLPYFSQIRAITKPKLSTFDAEAEVQKVETSKLDNLIVSTYGMVDNSMTNESFKRKNDFKPRINSYVNPIAKVKERMNLENNNNNSQYVTFIEDDYIEAYGLRDESILNELTNLENEEALKSIQYSIIDEGSHDTLAAPSTRSNSHAQSFVDNQSDSQNNLSDDQKEQQKNQDYESNENINPLSQSYVHFNSNPSSKSNINIEHTTSNINQSNSNMTNSNTIIDKSTSSMIQSNQNISGSNPKMNPSGSYDNRTNSDNGYGSENGSESTNGSGSDDGTRSESGKASESGKGGNTVSQSYNTISSQTLSQEKLDIHNNDNNRSHESSTNSLFQNVNDYLMNKSIDRTESLGSIPDDAVLFPEVADGETLKIIQNNEFQNLLEEILESTVFNILQEANAGEFDLTKKPAFCYYKTYNNCRNIIGSDSAINININSINNKSEENEIIEPKKTTNKKPQAQRSKPIISQVQIINTSQPQL